MGILSDDELRRRIGAGELIDGGDPERATECSYNFLPGKAFLPGSTAEPVTCSGHDFVVPPGQMVWIRVRERVRVPHDLVGLWWQTNTLSRKGLMLVNMSMVEPGYAGDLACLFVNFGKDNILITENTVVAKMIFTELKGTVVHPFTGTTTRDEYDTRLRELAMRQPKSFLQVGDLTISLEKARQDALSAIAAEGMTARAKATVDLTEARVAAVKDFKEDIPATLRRSFAWALGLFAILTLATMAADYIQGKLVPDVQKIARSEAEDALGRRVSIGAAPKSDETLRLEADLSRLNARLAALEKQRSK